MIEIPVLVTSAWTALQPLLPLIAAKGAEKIGETAGADLWNAIKKKFDTKATAREALEELLKAPQDTDVQGQFRAQLKKSMQEDASFAAELSNLLEKAGGDFKAQNIGDGAIAQGAGAKAVGKDGIMIDGDLTGNITIGNNNRVNSK